MRGGRRVRGAAGRGRAWRTGLACMLALSGAAEASELHALLDSAGAVRHLQAWSETNVLAREAVRGSLPSELASLLLREVEDAFAPEALLADVSTRIAASLDARAIAALRLRYDVSGAAGLIGPPDGIPVATLRAFPAFASAVSRREVPPARFLLVGRLDEATGLGRNAWRVSAAVGRALLRGAAALRCARDAWRGPLPAEEARRTRLAGPFQERLHVELLFLTRERDEPQLRRALRFLESPPARELHRALGEATGPALAAARERLRERLAVPAAQRCGEQPAQGR